MPPNAAQRRFEVDPHVGMFPPGRVQEERAWAEILKKERRIQDQHARQELPAQQRGRLWPGGSVHGSFQQDSYKPPSRPPFASDSDAWARDLTRHRGGGGHPHLEAMHTRELMDMQRRAAKELEKREWREAVQGLNTKQLSGLADMLQDKLNRRKGIGVLRPPATPPSPPRTPPLPRARAGMPSRSAR